MYETIVFDLDGTLLDTLDDLTGAVNYALSAFGLKTRTREEVRSFVGNGVANLMQRAVGCEHLQQQEILQVFKTYYKEHCADKTKPYEGVLPLLEELKKRGVKTAVLSNKADFAVKSLAETYFKGLLREAVGENEAAGIRRKPAPDALFSVMERLGAKRATTVYVGDSEVDIQTAANAGVDCISVTWGFKDKKFLEESGATNLIDEPFEVLSFCKKQEKEATMSALNGKIDEYIGNTPLVELTHIQEKFDLKARLYAKLEYFNPGGSIKDRVAKAMLDDAEKTGRLKKGGTVIEATSGNTGIGLALVAAARGYKAVIVMPETMSVERQKLMKAYGAELVLTDGKKGMSGAVERAEEILKNTPNAIIAGQFDNPANPKAHYETTGPEIYAQTEGKTDIFVAGIGTGGTLSGAGKYLKEQNSSIRVVGVEPASSPLLTKGVAGAHAIQGIGANFVPKNFDKTVCDEILTVENESAFEMSRLIGKTEGIFVGISSGAALAAAVEIAKRPENEGKIIVVILPDGGDRYLSTALFVE